VKLRHAECAEFELDGHEPQWCITGREMKMRAQHVFVPLASQAVALLRELQPVTGRGRYMFPSPSRRLRPMSETP